MTAFEYILIPIAMIMGYAVTAILRSWAALVRGESAITKMLPYLNTTIVMLSLLFLNFTGLWSYRNVDFDSQGGPIVLLPLLLMAAPMLAFTLAISILIPTDVSAYRSIENHYLSTAKPFFLTLAIAILVTIIPDHLPGVSWAPPTVNSVLYAIFVACFAFIKSIWFHRIGGALLHIPILGTLLAEASI